MGTQRSTGILPVLRCATQPTKLNAFKYQVRRLWLRALRRRSQRHRITGERMDRLAAKWLPPVRTLHPYPEQRLRVST